MKRAFLRDGLSRQLLLNSIILFLSVFISMSQADITTGLAGSWNFDDPADLTKAAAGNDLTLVGSHALTEGIDGIDGAVSIGVGNYYISNHGIAPNGGGSYVNEWSIVIDFKYPALGWICFFQTNQSNSNDGDCFVNTGTGSLGVSDTGYTPRITQTETWYRMVVTVDNGNFYRIYVNGELWLNGNAQGIDGRFALDPTLLLFADDNGEDNLIDVSMVALYDRPLSAADVMELKGPGGEDVEQQSNVLTDPYLQNVKQDGITVMWELDGQVNCVVEYGLDASYDMTASCTNVPSGAGTYIYKSVITGLDAETTYDFRVVVDSEALADQTFTTAPIGYANFTFGVWSDSQGTNHNDYPADPYEPTKAMMSHMSQRVDIAVTCGDLAENGGSYGDTKAYYVNRVAKLLGTTVPWFVAWGNHDGGSTTVIRKFADMPSNDRGGSFHAGYGSFSYDYAGCHFVCIDNAEGVNYIWLEDDLQQAVADRARFIFLFVHKAPYFERWYNGEPDLRTNLVPLMEQYGVDVCFSGHMHGYERGYLNGVYYCITGGGSWLDYPEPLTGDWPHMTVGGYHDLAPGIDGGLVHEYVKIDIDEFGFTANLMPFHPDGTFWDGVTDTFGKTDVLADIVTDGHVDAIDFSLLANHWVESCAGGDCNNADVNGDGIININDLTIVMKSWLWQE